MSTEVLRSTNRFVNRSCSASDSLSSISRVFSCQCAGSASQPGRLDTKVQVRICAMRCDSVSMSPSVNWRGAPARPCSSRRHGRAGEVGEHRGDQVGVLGRRDLAVVRQRAGFPQQLHPLRRAARSRISGRGQLLERLRIDRRQRPRQAFDRRRRLDRAGVSASRLAKSKSRCAIAAPSPDRNRCASILLDQIVVERIDLAGDAERAVTQMPPGAAGDLAELGRGRSRYW